MKETLPIMSLAAKNWFMKYSSFGKWSLNPRWRWICKNIVASAVPYLSKWIVAFWINPLKVETGYGYIEKDYETNKIKLFHEKPNYETAKKIYWKLIFME